VSTELLTDAFSGVAWGNKGSHPLQASLRIAKFQKKSRWFQYHRQRNKDWKLLTGLIL